MSRPEFDCSGENSVMKSGPARCVFNMPGALKALMSGGQEIAHGLPQHRRRRAYLVDKYPACPKSWDRSTGNMASYFVPIVNGSGMWLDFNETLKYAGNHVAVVISVQGVNPLTGLECTDMQLEQYTECCPTHKTKFGPDRLCTTCNFRWPKQNYIATTGTPDGLFWLDGFRAPDGVIRQYLLTTEKARGVANAIMGEKRVFAIGLAFFLSKEPRPKPQPRRKSDGVTLNWCGPIGGGLKSYEDAPIGSDGGCDDTVYYTSTMNSTLGDAGSKGLISGAKGLPGMKGEHGFDGPIASASAPMARRFAIGGQSVNVQKVEVAAGAQVRQIIYDDPFTLDYWVTSPESVILVNYALEVDVEEILKGGEIDVSGSPEGFLQKIPVGN